MNTILMHTRGQLLGHIVIFVLGLVVIGGVVLFGYSVLEDINEDRCDVQRVQFATQLSTFIDRNRGWGTDKPVQLDAPCETTAVCFVDRRLIDEQQADAETPVNVPVDDPIGNADSVIPQSVNSLDQTNVFTVQPGGSILPVERFSSVAAPIKVYGDGNTDPKATCIDAPGGTLNIRMAGDGSHVRISEAAP